MMVRIVSNMGGSMSTQLKLDPIQPSLPVESWFWGLFISVMAYYTVSWCILKHSKHCIQSGKWPRQMTFRIIFASEVLVACHHSYMVYLEPYLTCSTSLFSYFFISVSEQYVFMMEVNIFFAIYNIVCYVRSKVGQAGCIC